MPAELERDGSRDKLSEWAAYLDGKLEASSTGETALKVENQEGRSWAEGAQRLYTSLGLGQNSRIYLKAPLTSPRTGFWEQNNRIAEQGLQATPAEESVFIVGSQAACRVALEARSGV